MAKPDFTALLPAGLHIHTLASVEALAVLPFPGDTRRVLLFRQLSGWVQALQSANVSGILWIDGSFMTEKYGPDDVDCVLWNPQFTTAATQNDQIIVQKLLNKPTARASFNLDLYIEAPLPIEMFDKEAYWKGVWGFCHDRVTAKGFAELRI